MAAWTSVVAVEVVTSDQILDIFLMVEPKGPTDGNSLALTHL